MNQVSLWNKQFSILSRYKHILEPSNSPINTTHINQLFSKMQEKRTHQNNNDSEWQKIVQIFDELFNFYIDQSRSIDRLTQHHKNNFISQTFLNSQSYYKNWQDYYHSVSEYHEDLKKKSHQRLEIVNNFRRIHDLVSFAYLYWDQYFSKPQFLIPKQMRNINENMRQIKLEDLERIYHLFMENNISPIKSEIVKSLKYISNRIVKNSSTLYQYFSEGKIFQNINNHIKLIENILPLHKDINRYNSLLSFINENNDQMNKKINEISYKIKNMKKKIENMRPYFRNDMNFRTNTYNLFELTQRQNEMNDIIVFPNKNVGHLKHRQFFL